MDLEKEWYNIAETSNIVGLSKQSIRRDIKAGRIENIKRQGKLFFINKEEVLSLFDLTNNYYTTAETAKLMNRSGSAVIDMASTVDIKTRIYKKAMYFEKNKIDELSDFLKNTLTLSETAKKYNTYLGLIRFLVDENLVKSIRINNKDFIDITSMDNVLKEIQNSFYLNDISDITMRHLKAFKSGCKGKTIEILTEELGITHRIIHNLLKKEKLFGYKFGDKKGGCTYFIPQEEVDNFFNTIEGIKIRYHATDEVYKMHSELMECIMKSTKYAKDTLEIFREWSMTRLTKSTARLDLKRMSVSQYVDVATVLSENLVHEIWECDENEMSNLRKKIKENSIQQVFSKFYSYIQTVKTCKTDATSYTAKVNSNDNDKEKIYSVEEWLMIKDYLVDLNKHIENAKKDARYAQSWLFAILHLSLAWRSNDFLQINAIPVKEILSCENIEEFDFFKLTQTQAQQVVNALRTTCIPIVAHKNGQEAHMIFPPQLIVSTAVAICISEIHRFKNNRFKNKQGKLIMYKAMNNTVVNDCLFPNDLPKFVSLKCNRSKQTYSFITASNTTGRAHIAYSLTGFSRSHKPKVTGVNESTMAYLIITDTTIDAKHIGKHLFERGIFGWQVQLMLGVLECYNQDTLEQRTMRIKELSNKYSPTVMESMSNYLTIGSDDVKQLVDELMTLSGDELTKKLIEICEFKSPAFLNYTQCMKGTSNCKYLEGKVKCLGCRYNIPTNYVLEIVNERLNETLDLIDQTHEADKIKLMKYTYIIRQLMFIIMDFRRCTKEYFEDDYIKSFIDLKSISHRFQSLEQTGKILQIEGEKNGG